MARKVSNQIAKLTTKTIHKFSSRHCWSAWNFERLRNVKDIQHIPIGHNLKQHFNVSSHTSNERRTDTYVWLLATILLICVKSHSNIYSHTECMCEHKSPILCLLFNSRFFSLAFFRIRLCFDAHTLTTECASDWNSCCFFFFKSKFGHKRSV